MEDIARRADALNPAIAALNEARRTYQDAERAVFDAWEAAGEWAANG